MFEEIEKWFKKQSLLDGAQISIGRSAEEEYYQAVIETKFSTGIVYGDTVEELVQNLNEELLLGFMILMWNRSLVTMAGFSFIRQFGG